MADIKIGNLDISAFKVGSGDCSVYLGSIQLYPQDTPVTSPKWIATYSDSSTSSAECDSTSSITNGDIEKTNLISVEIGDCVTSIGESAFDGCSSLTSITIGSGVTSIGDYAFYGCSSLASITIPDSVTSIGVAAFVDCTSLTSITIGSGVTSIGDGAFYGCSSLASVTIPSGVTNIGNSAFDGCTGLTSITVNATTPATLGSMAFDNTNDCPIYVPAASVETYKAASEWSFYESRIQAIEAKWIATYSDSSTSSAECDSTSAITNGDIEKTNLISVEIGDCVSAIVGECFSDCSKLSAVTINGYTSIDDYSFARNNGTLKTIIMLSPTPPPCANTAFTYYNHGYVPMTSITIYVPAASVEAYKAASGWSRYADKIQAIANT